MKPRLLLVSLYYHPEVYSGANIRFRNFANRLPRYFDVTLALRKGARSRGDELPPGKAIELDFSGGLSRIRAWIRLNCFAAQGRFDYVYSDFFPAILPIRPATRYLYQLHDFRSATEFSRSNIGKLPTYLIQRAFLGICGEIVTVSEASRRHIAARSGVAPDRILVSYNGASEAFRNQHLAGRDIDLIYVSAFDRRKNHKRFLDAIRSEPYRVTLVGQDLGELNAIRALIAQPDFRPRVQIRSGIPEADLNRLYNRSRICVFPSLFEGQGMAIAEGVLAGCRIACSDLEVFREIVSGAAFFDPLDPAAIRRAIAEASRQDHEPGLIVPASWDDIVRQFAARLTGDRE